MKHITSKLLSLLLCLAMLMSMVPAAYADVETEGASGKNTPTETNGGASEQDDAYDDAPDTAVVQSTAAATTDAAKVGETGYTTLDDAITAAKDGDTVTLLADRTEDVTITTSITLDLGGKTLTNTNAGNATLTVAAGATATVMNGRIDGGTGYYNIQNKGTATFEDVTATAGNNGSSMIDNYGDLTINSGDYSGGLDTIKNEPNAKLTITGGKFTLEKGTSDGFTGVVFNYGELNISDGEFIQSDKSAPYGQAQVIHTDKNGNAVPRTTITGGSFINECARSTAWTVRQTNAAGGCTEVKGGTFNKKVTASYLADGYTQVENADGMYSIDQYVAMIGTTGYKTLAEAITAANESASNKTITLLQDVMVADQIVINNVNGKSVTLDLGKFTLTSTYALDNTSSAARYALVNNTPLTVKNGTFAAGEARAIGGYAKLTLNGATVTQTLTGGHACVAFCADGATYTVNNKSVIKGAYSLCIFANNATVNISNSTLEGTGNTLYHNGTNYGLKLTVKNTKITSSGSCGVYISGSTSAQSNEANRNGIGGYQQASFKNCTISGAENGIEVKYTDLTLDGCTVSSTATGEPSYSQNDNGPAANGFAVVSTDNAMNNTTPKPEGTIIIKGNGSYTGLAGLGALESVKDSYTGFKDETIKVSGGTFSSKVLPEYCADGFVPTENTDGTYGVKVDTSVAEVNGVKYKTLQAAIDAAPRKATVKLLADTKENVTISTPYVTLDLNGHTLNGSTGERKPALTITARVTVMDSSAAQTGTIMREDTAENSGVSSHYVIDVQGGGWLTFESGTVKNDSGAGGTKGASLVRVGDDSVAKYPGLNIKGGTFTQDNFIVIKVDRGDLFLNGGTLNCANSYAVENWHRATIKGGTVNGNVSSWTYSSGLNSELTINGGTVNGNVESVSYDGAEGKLAKVAITGGTVNGTLSTKRYGEEAAPSKDMATIEVTGGTFSSDPTKYVVEDSAVTNNSDGTFGVAKAYLAKVGDTSYYTMDEAFKAQTASGAEIVLLRDYTTGSTFNSGSVARVVNLNGYTWTCTGTDANSAAFEINNPNASLTVKNGKIVSSQLVGLIPSAMGGTIKYDNSSLTFENVEMSTTATSGIETNGNNTNDSVTLRNSTLNVPNGFGIYFPSSGTLTIDNSTINAKTMGVQVCAGSLSINAGSTITVSGGPVEKTENDGAIQDGAAISIVNRTGYKGLGDITVTGGTFTAKSGNAAIKAYNWDNTTKKEDTFTASDKVSVSGGTFSSEVKPEYCAPGFVPKANSDGTYGVTRHSSGSSSSDPTYAVSAPSKTENGSVTVSPKTASKGDTVTITVKPDSGYVLETLTVTDKNGNELTLKDKGDGKYTFTMPAGKVEVKATFMEDNSMLNFFYDVPNGAFFYEAVKWAVKSGVTNGLSDTMFGPYESCTRAQIVTFLWRAAGSPEPKTASSFTDVPVSTYYAKAVAWAVENGITNGMTETTFAPDATCTRGQSVTFLHRALKGTASGSANFTDVKPDAFYADAVSWAVKNDVTNGTSNTTFSPNADCTRAEIVTFLYRAYQGK